MVKNHPFADGNKRTALLLLLYQLGLYGYRPTASGEAFEALVVAVAAGELADAYPDAWEGGAAGDREVAALSRILAEMVSPDVPTVAGLDALLAVIRAFAAPLRRLKDEWRKQDAERQTRQAIEQEKLDRAKKLESLSKEEREVWLKMHKDELEKEKREELEKKMHDEKSQDELKKLVEKVKKEKLAAAEKEIDAAGKEMQSENERAKLDKAKAENAEKAK
jgi:hypothetical protein